jgi:hypothetical protein
MIKKVLVVAASALFSLNASAAYVQYNFSGPLSGYIIQNDKDQSIANFKFDLAFNPAAPGLRAAISPQLSEGSTRITEATTYFANNGPDNFKIYSDFGADQTTRLSIDFAGATLGNLAYTGAFTYSRYTYSGYQNYAGSLGGIVTVGVVDDLNGGYYDGMNSAVIPRLITRGDVPEPASLALFLVGAVGALGVARLRKGA